MCKELAYVKSSSAYLDLTALDAENPGLAESDDSGFMKFKTDKQATNDYKSQFYKWTDEDGKPKPPKYVFPN